MLSEIERDALEDIRDNIPRAMRFVHGLDLEGFLIDDESFYAAMRCLEIISEASRRLSPAFKERFPDIPCRDVAGSGSIYRHNHEDVLERRVWQTIHEALPPLRALVDAALQQRSRTAPASQLAHTRDGQFILRNRSVACLTPAPQRRMLPYLAPMKAPLAPIGAPAFVSVGGRVVPQERRSVAPKRDSQGGDGGGDGRKCDCCEHVSPNGFGVEPAAFIDRAAPGGLWRPPHVASGRLPPVNHFAAH